MDLFSLTDANRVRVVVMPVGPISPSRFRHYFQFIASSFHTLPLAHLTRNVTNKNRVLKQDWVEGVFRFHFTEFKDWHKSEWEELHSMRKTLAVVGIIDGAVTADWAAAYKTMVDSLKRFPSVLWHLCFTLDPGDKPDVERNPHLIIVPMAGGGPAFYLQTWMQDLASRLIRIMEDWVFDGNEAQAALTTSMDYNQGPDDVQKLKKRKASRLLKNKADFCLLVSAPADALNYFNDCLTQTRATGDTLWYAAALEGHATATLLLALPETGNHQLSSVSPEVMNEVTETLAEAVLSYNKRKAFALEVETRVRIGKLYAACGEPEAANEAWMAAQHVAGSLTKQLKIQLYMELTALYHDLGMRRKSAFFLREAGLLHAKIFNHALSHRLLSLASPSFLLFSDALPSQALLSVAQRDKAARMKEVPVGWAVLQKYLLKDLIDSSKNANDPNTTAGYITFLLRNYRDLLTNKYQIKLATALSAVTDDLPVSLQMTMLGLPLLVSVTPDPLPPSLCAYSTQRVAAEKSIFITSPFERKKDKKAEIVWVENEVAEVQVLLSNPMAFPIPIESISLSGSTTGVAFEAYGVALVVPPHTTKMSVLLSGKPLASGTLFIKGCTIRTFNLLCEHPVGANGKGISLTEASRLKFEAGQTNAVRVVPSLPRILVRDQSAAAGNISLCIGQEASSEYEVENIGGQPITYMDLTVQANYQQSHRDPPSSTFTWDSDKIQRALPLVPGAKFTFSACFTAKPLTIGHTLTINYGNEKHAEYSRRVEVSCPVNLLQGLGVGRIDTIEWAGTAIPFADIPAVTPPCVLLSFEVVNSGPTVFSLECQGGAFFTSKAITISPHSSKRVLLPMRKFVLPPLELIPNVPTNKQRRVPEVDRYLAELSRRVVMRWKSLTSNSDGVLSFVTSNVFFPESGISLLSAPPVNVLMRVRGKGDATAVSTPLFEFHEIEVIVHNSSNKARLLMFSLLSYQDFNNGIIESNLQGKVTVAGAPHAKLAYLEPGKSLSHVLVVSFLAGGRYKFAASCKDEDGQIYTTPAPFCVIAG